MKQMKSVHTSGPWDWNGLATITANKDHRCDQGHKIHGEMERDDADGEYVLFSDWEAERKIKEAEKLILLEEVAKNVQLRAQLTALEAENQKLREAISRHVTRCPTCGGITGTYKALAYGAGNPTEQRCPACSELRAALSNAGEGKEKGK